MALFIHSGITAQNEIKFNNFSHFYLVLLPIQLFLLQLLDISDEAAVI